MVQQTNVNNNCACGLLLRYPLCYAESAVEIRLADRRYLPSGTADDGIVDQVKGSGLNRTRATRTGDLPYSTALYRTVVCTVRYGTVRYRTLPYLTVLYCAVPYSTALHRTALYCTVLHYAVPFAL